MLYKSSLPTLVVLLAGLLLAALLLLLTAGLSASHDPLREVLAHTGQLVEVSGDDQDAAHHDHDGDSTKGDHGGHQHAHSAIYHSHESMFALPEHALLLRASAMPWNHRGGIDPINAVVAVPKRPPKPATA